MHIKEKFAEYLDKRGKYFICLTDDLLFKETFGRRENRKFLEDLLECYHNYDKGYLKNKLDVRYESILEKEDYFNKSVRSDLLVKYDNTITDLEMYKLYNEESKIKSDYYIMRIYTSKLEIGDSYKTLTKTTQINFISEDKIGISEDIKYTKEINKNVSQDYILLDNIKNKPYNEDERFMRYLKFIGANSYEERKKCAKGDEMLMELNDWLDAYCNDEANLKFLNDRYWDKRIYGLEGEKKGINTVAKNLLNENVSLKTIESATGLSKEQIARLKKEN